MSMVFSSGIIPASSHHTFSERSPKEEAAANSRFDKLMERSGKARLEKEALDVLDVWAKTKTAGDSDFGWLHHEAAT